MAAGSRVTLDISQSVDRAVALGPSVIKLRIVRDSTPLRTLIAQPPDIAAGYVSASLIDDPPATGPVVYRTEFRVVSGGNVRAQTGGAFLSTLRATELAAGPTS